MNLSTECKEWAQGQDGSGYGAIRFLGKAWRIHRLAYIFAHGFAPRCVLHRCDNRKCYEETHLFDGSRADNHKDMVAKGRHGMSLRTHCKLGHPLNGIKHYRTGPRAGRKVRYCKICVSLH